MSGGNRYHPFIRRVNVLEDTMGQEESISADNTSVFCDGGENERGHPGVYLNIGEEGEAVCPYCSQRFVLDKAREQ
jgi:uncharacterized Zn-finger protein